MKTMLKQPNLKITLRAIQYFERMTDVPFTEIDNKPELVSKLLYCAIISHPENNCRLTYEEALPIMEKSLAELIAVLDRETKINQQFHYNVSCDTDIHTDDSSTGEKEKFYMSSVIPMLVNDCGLDIRYVMDEMPYSDIDMWVKWNVKKSRDELEDKRFWAYLNISPHIDHRKCKKPQDLMKFPWENEKKVDDFKKHAEMMTAKLKALGILRDNQDSSTGANQ